MHDSCQLSKGQTKQIDRDPYQRINSSKPKTKPKTTPIGTNKKVLFIEAIVETVGAHQTPQKLIISRVSG